MAISVANPATLRRDISPPPPRKISSAQPQAISMIESGAGDGIKSQKEVINRDDGPSLAAIEAGQAQIQDHLEYFTKHLKEVSRPTSHPRLNIQDFNTLYRHNQHKHGRHFVVHQHDHPISGIYTSICSTKAF